jgi:hypothetical protein
MVIQNSYIHCLLRTYSQFICLFFVLKILSLFWKNKGLLSSPCCLCVCARAHACVHGKLLLALSTTAILHCESSATHYLTHYLILLFHVSGNLVCLLRMVSSGMLRHAALVLVTRATWHNIPEDTILHSHRRENLKSYTVCLLTASYSARSDSRDKTISNSSSVSLLSMCISVSTCVSISLLGNV